MSTPFAAIADPTRRHLVERLTVDGPTTATALAAELDVSRQAVAKHLGILTDAGLARSQRVGRETRFHPEPMGLAAIRTWVDDVESAWANRLDRLSGAVERRGSVG